MPERIAGMTCPTCSVTLVRERFVGASRPTCPRCAGCVVTVALLRRIAPKERVDAIWAGAISDGANSPRVCPSCAHPLRLGRVEVDATTLEIDACRRCQLLWFDGGELMQFSPERLLPDPHETDPSAEAHARWMAEHRRQVHERLETMLERMADPRLGVYWF